MPHTQPKQASELFDLLHLRPSQTPEQLQSRLGQNWSCNKASPPTPSAFLHNFTMAAFRVKALYDYSSPHEDDLNFPNGQIITVTDQEDADWYGGEYVDDDGVKHEGIFPRNFVEKFEPTAPPRPSRSRPRKEPEPAEEVAAPPPPPAQQQAPPVPKFEPEPEPEAEEVDEPIRKRVVHEPVAPAAPEPASSKPVESVPAPAPPPAVPKPVEVPVFVPVPAPAPAAAPSQPPKPKPGPPPVSEKPTSNSFKDRIAAFNKPAAPPIAPFKPSGLSGSGGGNFIRKPFVAPPPSRHAYVPPPQQAPTAKIYRRDEDPEIKEREVEAQGQAERAGLVPAEATEGDADQPKPTSLKERIALLQKQQMEQAQRHAEAAVKKEKPKRPQKKRESIGHAEALGEVEGTSPPQPSVLERRSTEESGGRTSTDEPGPNRAPPVRRKMSKGPAVDPVHDGNEADMSGAGDTTDVNDDVTERDDSDAVSRRASRVPALPIQPMAAVAPPPEDDSDEEVAQEEEEDVDPEVKRKEELRARMAKMSGGMGFHGMFGAPMPGPPPKKKKAPKAEAPHEDEEVEETSPSTRAVPPIPTMMALPGMGGARKSEETPRPDHESEHSTRAPPPPIPSLPPRAVEDDEDEDDVPTPAPTGPPARKSSNIYKQVRRLTGPPVPTRDIAPPPPVPGGRPAVPPVPPTECKQKQPHERCRVANPE